ncbi:unnamed protein product [Closterium sp. Naga37s-1]|nr:unnamed protein product [Closterium sp. Naga37s-1]
MWSRTEPAPAVGVGSGGVIRGEMGAQWIQSSTGNPITALARRFKLNIGEQNGEEIQYRAGGKAYTDFQLKVASAKYDWALKRAKQIANKQDNDISMEKAFRAAGNFLNPYIQSRVAVDLEFEYAGDLSTLSAWYYEDDAFQPPDLVVTNGYDNIPKKLMEVCGRLLVCGRVHGFDRPDLVAPVAMAASPKCASSYVGVCLCELIPRSPSPTSPLLHTPTSLLSLLLAPSVLIPPLLQPPSSSLPFVPTSYPTPQYLTPPLSHNPCHVHLNLCFSLHLSSSLIPIPVFLPFPHLPLQEATDAGAQLVLNFEVTAITRLSSGAVQITGKDTTSGATRSYTGDAAIITLPLGVLKAGVVTFSPALSARKQGAIRRVGFGDVIKVFFFYNTTFWPTWADEYFIEDAQLPGNRGRWVDWVNLKRAWGMTALEGVACPWRVFVWDSGG